MIRFRKLVFLAFAVMTFSTAVSQSYGQTVPYKAHGTGSYSPVTGDYSGTGVGTHLGNQTFTGNVEVTPTTTPGLFNWQSTVPQETVAANGDKLYFNASGQVQLIPLDSPGSFSAVWTGDFVVVGGTGRFANAGPAAQPLQVIAINDPFTFATPEWTFSWTLTGEIVLH